jgi:hypothetical protein
MTPVPGFTEILNFGGFPKIRVSRGEVFLASCFKIWVDLKPLQNQGDMETASFEKLFVQRKGYEEL